MSKEGARGLERTRERKRGKVFFLGDDGCGGRRAIAACPMMDAPIPFRSLQLARLSISDELEALTCRYCTELSSTLASRRRASQRLRREGARKESERERSIEAKAAAVAARRSHPRRRGTKSWHALRHLSSLRGSTRPSAIRIRRALSTAGVAGCDRARALSRKREREQLSRSASCFIACSFSPRCGRLLLCFPSTRADKTRAISNRRRLGKRKSTRKELLGAVPRLELRLKGVVKRSLTLVEFFFLRQKLLPLLTVFSSLSCLSSGTKLASLRVSAARSPRVAFEGSRVAVTEPHLTSLGTQQSSKAGVKGSKNANQ